MANLVTKPDNPNSLDARLVRSLEGKRILIAGASGFAGTAIARKLNHLKALRLDAHFVGLARVRPTLGREDPRRVFNEWLIADLRGPLDSNSAFDIILHLASPSSTRPAGQDSLEELVDMISSVTNLISFAASQKQPPRVLYASSGAIYGPVSTVVTPTTVGCINSMDPGQGYATAKLTCENMLVIAGVQGKLDPLIARMFAFVGPDLPQDKHFAIGNFLGDAIAGRPIRIRGTGQVVRSYQYQGEMAEWLLAAALWGPPGRPLNVGSEQQVTLEQVAREIADQCHLDVEIDGDESFDGPRSFYVPDISETLECLGLEAPMAMSDAIRTTLSCIRIGAHLGGVDC